MGASPAWHLPGGFNSFNCCCCLSTYRHLSVSTNPSWCLQALGSWLSQGKMLCKGLLPGVAQLQCLSKAVSWAGWAGRLCLLFQGKAAAEPPGSTWPPWLGPRALTAEQGTGWGEQEESSPCCVLKPSVAGAWAHSQGAESWLWEHQESEAEGEDGQAGTAKWGYGKPWVCRTPRAIPGYGAEWFYLWFVPELCPVISTSGSCT